MMNRKSAGKVEMISKNDKLSKDVLFDLHVIQNMSCKQISEKCNVDEKTVANWLKFCRFDSIPDKIILENLYLKQFHNLTEIAKIYNVDSFIVSKWFKKYQIPIRLFGKEIEQPTKEILERLYYEEKLTKNQISKFYNIEKNVIDNWFVKHNLKKIEGRKFYHLKATPFDKSQKEFIIGSLLSRNGTIKKIGKHKSLRLDLDYNRKLSDYFFWAKSVLNNYVNTVNIEDKKSEIILHLHTIHHNELTLYYKLFFDNNKKVIKDDLSIYLKPFGMAVWFMNCGIKINECGYRLSTNHFSKKENELLKQIIKINFGINCKVVEYIKNNKQYYYLSFNKRNSLLLTELIEQYIIDSMKYKLIDRSSTTKCKAP